MLIWPYFYYSGWFLLYAVVSSLKSPAVFVAGVALLIIVWFLPILWKS